MMTSSRKVLYEDPGTLSMRRRRQRPKHQQGLEALMEASVGETPKQSLDEVERVTSTPPFRGGRAGAQGG